MTADGPRPLVILLTGLPSSGKSTLGLAIEAQLGKVTACQLLDGDELRDRLPPRLGFSLEDRRHQGQRALYIASLLARWNVAVVVAVIAPLEETRRAFREAFIGGYVEVYLHAEARVRSGRDTRGVYARAIAEGDAGFMTIDEIYEPPTDPDLAIDTGVIGLQASVDEVMAVVERRRR